MCDKHHHKVGLISERSRPDWRRSRCHSPPWMAIRTSRNSFGSMDSRAAICHTVCTLSTQKPSPLERYCVPSQYSNDLTSAPRTLRESVLDRTSHLESGRKLHRPPQGVNTLEVDWSKFLTRNSSAVDCRRLTGKFVSGVIPPWIASERMAGAYRVTQEPRKRRSSMPPNVEKRCVEFLDTRLAPGDPVRKGGWYLGEYGPHRPRRGSGGRIAATARCYARN